jgi:hypothetical protein
VNAGLIPIWSAIWGLIGTLIGGAIGFVSAYVATTRTINAQESLQKERFARDERATRSILEALLIATWGGTSGSSTGDQMIFGGDS